MVTNFRRAGPCIWRLFIPGSGVGSRVQAVYRWAAVDCLLVDGYFVESDYAAMVSKSRIMR